MFSITKLKILINILLVSMATAVQADSLIYVTNSQSASISVIDTDTDTVTHIIAVDGAEPVAVAAHPFEPIAYVNDRLGKLYIIDTRTHTITGSIEFENKPDAGLAFHPDGSRAYVTQRAPGGGFLTVIDTNTETVIENIAMGNTPSGVAIHPEGHTAYVSNFLSNDNYIVDLITSTVLDILPGGEHPQGVTMSPDGNFVYVPNRSDATVTVIATASNSIVATIPVGTTPGLPGFQPDSSLAYVPSRGDRTIAVVDVMSNHTVIDEIQTGSGSGNVWVIVHPDEEKMYITQQEFDAVSIVDTVRLKSAGSISVGQFPIGLGFIPVADLSAESVSPRRIRKGSFFRDINVTGIGFRPDMQLSIPQSAGVQINSMTFVNDNDLVVNLSVSQKAQEATRDIVFTNTDGQTFVLVDAIEIISSSR